MDEQNFNHAQSTGTSNSEPDQVSTPSDVTRPATISEPAGVSSDNKKSTLKVILIVLILILISGSVAAYFLFLNNNEQTSSVDVGSTQNDTETTQQIEELVEEPATTIPEGYKLVENEYFSMNWPEEWEDPKIEIGPMDTVLERAFSEDVQLREDPEYWYVANDPNYARSSYDPMILRRDRDITVYEFGFGDAGCGYSKYVFTDGKNMYQIAMPVACAESQASENDYINGDEFTSQSEEVLFSIKFL